MNERFKIKVTLKNGRRVIRFMEIPRGMISPREIIPPFQRLYDEIISLELSESIASCKKGCGVCCNQLIPLSMLETYYLYELLNTFPSLKRRAIEDRVADIASVLKKKKAPLTLEQIHKKSNFEQDYFELGLPCPFLEEEKCGVYSRRPFACREYLVRTPPDYCASPSAHDLKKVPVAAHFGSLMTLFCSRLFRRDPLPIPLFLFIDFVSKNRSVFEKTVSGGKSCAGILNALCHAKLQNGSLIASLRWGKAEAATKHPS